MSNHEVRSWMLCLARFSSAGITKTLTCFHGRRQGVSQTALLTNEPGSTGNPIPIDSGNLVACRCPLGTQVYHDRIWYRPPSMIKNAWVSIFYCRLTCTRSFWISPRGQCWFEKSMLSRWATVRLYSSSCFGVRAVFGWRQSHTIHPRETNDASQSISPVVPRSLRSPCNKSVLHPSNHSKKLCLPEE